MSRKREDGLYRADCLHTSGWSNQIAPSRSEETSYIYKCSEKEDAVRAVFPLE